MTQSAPTPAAGPLGDAPCTAQSWSVSQWGEQNRSAQLSASPHCATFSQGSKGSRFAGVPAQIAGRSSGAEQLAQTRNTRQDHRGVMTWTISRLTASRAAAAYGKRALPRLPARDFSCIAGLIRY